MQKENNQKNVASPYTKQKKKQNSKANQNTKEVKKMKEVITTEAMPNNNNQKTQN